MKRQRNAGLHKYKGKPYYTIGSRYYLEEDALEMLEGLCILRRAIFESTDLRELLRAAIDFYGAIPQFNRINQCPAWLSAFKGAGAFYTMQNMIRFHGCTIEGMDMEKSEERLNEWAKQYGERSGYVLFAKMIDFIKANNFDFYKRMKEVSSK